MLGLTPEPQGIHSYSSSLHQVYQPDECYGHPFPPHFLFTHSLSSVGLCPPLAPLGSLFPDGSAALGLLVSRPGQVHAPGFWVYPVNSSRLPLVVCGRAQL